MRLNTRRSKVKRLFLTRLESENISCYFPLRSAVELDLLLLLLHFIPQFVEHQTDVEV